LAPHDINSRILIVDDMRALILLLPALLQAQTPRRTVPDPGVIATGQRITPAGVETVLSGKVSGVRFGASSDDIWIATPGSVHHMAWRDNRVIAHARVDGLPGVFSLAVDPTTGRVAASSVGRLTVGGAEKARRPAVTHLSFFDAATHGDSITPTFTSPALGDYMAGAPAIARRAGPDGHRLAVLPLPANDSLAVLDADSGALLRTIALGVEPIAAVISSDSRTAYVSILGGAKPGAKVRASTQCCDPRAESVRIDARGIAAAGSVSRVDLTSGRVTNDITVGRHPTALAWDEARVDCTSPPATPTRCMSSTPSGTSYRSRSRSRRCAIANPDSLPLRSRSRPTAPPCM
jgi:hypothetical protein